MQGKENNVIELKLDADGVYKEKRELRKDVKVKKKVERTFVNNASKIENFLYGLEVGTELFTKLSKIGR